MTSPWLTSPIRPPDHRICSSSSNPATRACTSIIASPPGGRAWARAVFHNAQSLSAASASKFRPDHRPRSRSEEHTSELQSLMRISYAVFCLKKKKQNKSIKHQDKHKPTTNK